MNQFEGTLVRLVFEDPESGYRIYAVDSDDVFLERNKYGNITIKGYLPQLKKAIEYTFVLSDEVTYDARFGPSYDNVVVMLSMPTNPIETIKFLSSIISMNKALSLYEIYPNIIELILESRDDEIDLSKVKGVKEKTFNKVKQKVLENFKYFNILSHFGDVFSLNVIKKLFDEYHNEAQVLEQLKVDPYRALCALDRIGFKRADQLILTTIDKDKENNVESRFDADLRTSYNRLLFYIQYVLENLVGHTYEYVYTIERDCQENLSEAFHHFEDVLNDPLFYVDENKIALKEVYELEQWIGETLNDSLNFPSSMHFEIDLENYQNQDNIVLDSTQLSLLPMVRDHQVSCLFGVAGSGKTTILKALLSMMNDEGKSVWLASPTGRAANILSQKTDYTAKTIHMMLGATSEGFEYNERKKIPADVIIIDEASMLDLSLFKSLLRAINLRTSKLLLVGDPQQLPSVGSGNVFEDIRRSDLNKLEINRCYRTTGGVLNAATEIREQRFHIPASNKYNLVTHESAYLFVQIEDLTLLNDQVLSIIDYSIKKFNYTLDDIMVISPVNQHQYGGALELNLLIQERYNSNDIAFEQTIFVKNKKKTIEFRLNDKIMNTKNDYKGLTLDHEGFDFLSKQSSFEDYDDLSVRESFIANGEIGRIELIFDDFIIINFNGLRIIKPKDELDAYQLGYAITTHKSQGSQAPCVITISTSNFSYMINSNHMYVGVTRAEKICFHIGTASTVNYKVKFKENKMRRTFLSELI